MACYLYNNIGRPAGNLSALIADSSQYGIYTRSLKQVIKVGYSCCSRGIATLEGQSSQTSLSDAELPSENQLESTASLNATQELQTDHDMSDGLEDINTLPVLR